MRGCRVVFVDDLPAYVLFKIGDLPRCKHLLVRTDYRAENTVLSYHCDLGDQRVAALYSLFYLGGIDIFAVSQNYDLLFSACYAEVAVLVEKTEVAGVEPSVFKHFRSLFRTVVIADHDVVSACQDLAVDDPDPAFFKFCPYESGFAFAWTGESYHRTCLGHAVAFAYRESDDFEEIPHRDVEFRPSADAVSDVPAESFCNGSENYF